MQSSWQHFWARLSHSLDFIITLTQIKGVSLFPCQIEILNNKKIQGHWIMCQYCCLAFNQNSWLFPGAMSTPLTVLTSFLDIPICCSCGFWDPTQGSYAESTTRTLVPFSGSLRAYFCSHWFFVGMDLSWDEGGNGNVWMINLWLKMPAFLILAHRGCLIYYSWWLNVGFSESARIGRTRVLF